MEFVREEVRHALATIVCASCGGRGATAVLSQEGPHFASIECLGCGRWLDWLGWPKEAAAVDRRRSRRQISRLGDDRCELCLRNRFEIPPPGQLEAQHVIEVQAGGGNDPDNLRVYCTSCHRLIHWLRTHFGHYHPDLAA